MGREQEGGDTDDSPLTLVIFLKRSLPKRAIRDY